MIFLVSVFLSVSSWAGGGGDWVGNGAGLSENRILIAFNGIEELIRGALNTTANEIDTYDRRLLEKMLVTIPQEKKKNPKMIQFKPHSSLFIIEGQPKVAVTGLSLGDPIFFNQDLLRSLDLRNEYSEITLAQATALILHELGHHQGITDHSYLDRLGAVVSSQALLETNWYPLHPGVRNLGAQLMAANAGLPVSGALYLVDQSQFINLSEVIQKAPLCESYQGSVLETLNFWNMVWLQPLSQAPTLQAYLAFECRWPSGRKIMSVSDQVQIGVKIQKVGMEALFSTQSLRIDFRRCDESVQDCQSLQSQYQKLNMQQMNFQRKNMQHFNYELFSNQPINNQ